jgi:endonuclease/exonuclease/phosphatase family metal-dependent hydrolase
VSPAAPVPLHAPDVVSVLTLNLWHDSGPYPARRALVRECVEELDPDVIGFQEALRGPGFDQVRDLLDEMTYHVEYARASTFWRDPKRAPGTRDATEFGNAIAARWPITERDVLELPDNGDGETRSALSVTVAAPQPVGPISVTCTHLHWKFHHSEVRERQVIAACDRVLARRRQGGFPPLLIGDFNAEPESAEIRYVTGLQSLRGRSVALLDAWRTAGKGPSGITWSNANDYARMGLEPDRRIDYVFAGFPRRDGIGQITHCRVVCNEPKGGVWPSDHFGVYAELRAVPLPEPPPFDDAA